MPVMKRVFYGLAAIWRARLWTALTGAQVTFEVFSRLQVSRRCRAPRLNTGSTGTLRPSIVTA